LVEPELALGGTGQAAGHEAQPQPGRPSLRHGNAAARHRRRTWPQSAAGDRLPALAAGAAAAADTGRRARTASAALVAGPAGPAPGAGPLTMPCSVQLRRLARVCARRLRLNSMLSGVA